MGSGSCSYHEVIVWAPPRVLASGPIPRLKHMPLAGQHCGAFPRAPAQVRSLFCRRSRHRRCRPPPPNILMDKLRPETQPLVPPHASSVCILVPTTSATHVYPTLSSGSGSEKSYTWAGSESAVSPYEDPRRPFLEQIFSDAISPVQNSQTDPAEPDSNLGC